MHAPIVRTYEREWFPVPADFKQSLLTFGAAFPHCVVLDSANSKVDQYGQYELLLGVASAHTATYKIWDDLKSAEQNQQWKFGVFTYELKDRFEPILESQNPASIPFPELYFFEPDIVIGLPKNSDRFWIEAAAPEKVNEIVQSGASPASLYSTDGALDASTLPPLVAEPQVDSTVKYISQQLDFASNGSQPIQKQHPAFDQLDSRQ